MAVNLTKNQEEISNAWRQVVNSKDTQSWAVFGYEGNTNNIKLMSTGSNGLDELVQEFNCSLIQYAFCRVIDQQLGINKLILINWQGDSSPLSRKGLCASHVGDVANYFKGCSQTITIRNDDEATKDYLMDRLVKSSSSRVSFSNAQTDTASSNSNVGSTYKKTDISSEIAVENRKSFWQRQEEEEKERILEEKKRAADKQAQFERERKLKEESEAKKLAETIKERDRLIEASRQTERRESSGGQSSSMKSPNDKDNEDDDRVGRRSELIRLERNQETQALISKGLIKNKRAIFEQASQEQQQQKKQQPSSGGNLSRRSSGTIVTQRLNTFKSFDAGCNSNATVEKLTNGFAKNVNVDGDTTSSTVKREVDSIKLTNESNAGFVSYETIAEVQPPKEVDAQTEAVTNLSKSPIKNGNCAILKDDSITVNENNNHNIDKSLTQEPIKAEDGANVNGRYGIRAKAMFDYEANDNTEISFDPDDIIGYIEKVDPGWWQGAVITGRYKGMRGLFPANYVEEI